MKPESKVRKMRAERTDGTRSEAAKQRAKDERAHWPKHWHYCQRAGGC